MYIHEYANLGREARCCTYCITIQGLKTRLRLEGDGPLCVGNGMRWTIERA